MITHVHHINFLVRDLASATKAFNTLFQQQPLYESLPAREADTARYQVGEVAIVLVSPTSATGTVGQYLEQRGEGVFLVSFGVQTLDDFWEEYESNVLVSAASVARNGLANWQVQDISLKYDLSAVLQICQEVNQ